MASRLVELADEVAAKLATAIGAPVDPLVVNVERVYVPSIDPEKLLANVRRVDVYPLTLADAGPLSRVIDAETAKIGVVVYERYTELGNAPKTWMDERLAWVETVIKPELKDPRKRFLGAYPELFGALVVLIEVGAVSLEAFGEAERGPVGDFVERALVDGGVVETFG
jgi:hypothetical protein